MEPLILDVRDPNEVLEGKGGPPGALKGAVNVPLNVDGQKQSDHATTLAEWEAKLKAAGVALDTKTAIITHCGSGGRGGRAAELLREMGFDAHNGGGPKDVAAARGILAARLGLRRLKGAMKMPLKRFPIDFRGGSSPVRLGVEASDLDLEPRSTFFGQRKAFRPLRLEASADVGSKKASR